MLTEVQNNLETINASIMRRLRDNVLSEARLRAYDKLSAMLDSVNVRDYPIENSKGYMRAITEIQKWLVELK